VDTEVAAALVGAGVAGVAGVLTWGLSELSASRRARRAERVALAREIVRYRGDQSRVAEALNHIPVIFGHDRDLIRWYRQFLVGEDVDNALLNIVERVVRITKLNRAISREDLDSFLTVKSTTTGADG
jgi:hypothetical protein